MFKETVIIFLFIFSIDFCLFSLFLLLIRFQPTIVLNIP